METEGITRRSFCASACGVLVLTALGAVKVCPTEELVRPPGGQDEEALLARCIRCQRCVEACPQGVISPVHIEKGVTNVRTPRLVFSDSWCDWCEREAQGTPLCVAACGTGALSVPEGATRKNVVMGLAVIDKDLCLAHRQMKCRTCHDACPYDAMEIDAAGRPVVIDKLCTGCGACEAACVSLVNASVGDEVDRRAITVVPPGRLQG